MSTIQIRPKPSAITSDKVSVTHLLMQSPALIAILKGREGVCTLFNEMFSHFRGGREVLQKPMREAWPELTNKGWFEIVEKVFDSGEPVYDNESSALAYLTKSNNVTERFYNLLYSPYHDENGKVEGTMIFGFEVNANVVANNKAIVSESYFRTLTETVPSIIWITEKDGSCSYLNNQWYEFTGQSAGAGLGFGWLNATHPEDMDQATQIFLNANEKQIPYEVFYRLRAKNDMYRWVMGKGAPRYSNSKEFNGFIGSVTDVHEQKEAEQLLQYRKALLEAHNEATNDGILIVDAKGKILSYNKRFQEIWNMPVSIVQAQDDNAALSFAMTQLVNPQQFIDKVNDLYNNPGNRSVDELHFKDGKIIERHGYPIIHDKNYYAWSWNFRDITAQKLFDKTLKESEERFRLLATSIPQIVWTSTAQGQVEYISSQWEKLTGEKPEDALKTWGSLIHPDDVDNVVLKWNESVADGKAWQVEYRLKNIKSGVYRWFMGNSQPLKNEKGEVIKWVGAATDIQSLKEYSAILEQSVNERTIQLKQSNEDLQQFAHVASHDLKEPIRKIKTFVGRLEQDAETRLSEKGKNFISKINKAAERMTSMVEGVLNYSILDGITQSVEKIDLNDVISNIESDLELLIEQKNAKLFYNDLPVIEGAPVLIFQLFYNLINNALKFGKENTVNQIHISGKIVNDKNQSLAKITLRDNGIGFEPEYAERIFDTFVRLNPKDKYEGTGLGLALCKKIVLRHQGSISATGIKDEGAEFNIAIPLKQSEGV